MDSNPIYKMKLKAEDRAEIFESSNYGFESPFGAQFKFCKGDSNPKVTDSNPPYVDALNAWSKQPPIPNFKRILSHND